MPETPAGAGGEPGEAPRSSRMGPFARKALVAAGIAILFLSLFELIGTVASVLLLIFAGVLLAVVLAGLAGRLSARTPLSYGWALAAVVAGLLAVAALAGGLLFPQIAAQADQLGETLPQSLEALREQLSRYRWGRALLEAAPAPQDAAGGGGVWSRVTGIFSTALGMVANLLFVLVLGVYFAADPGLYERGLMRLLPKASRERGRQIFHALGEALWGWMAGQLVAMTIIGVLTWLGLQLLGVPLALALGLIAGLLEFVPLIGPFASAVPALLIAFTDGPRQALYVALLFLGVQQIESNVITPIVMKKAVSLPPALTLSATVIAGAVFGLPGLLLATPLAVVAMVLVRTLYVEDVLGDEAGQAAGARTRPGDALE